MDARNETVSGSRALALTLAEESIVLLENRGRMLPLSKDLKLAVFGRTQVDTLFGGAGSGASRSESETLNIVQALRQAQAQIYEPLSAWYEKTVGAEVKPNPFAAVMEQGLDLVNSGIIYEIFGKYQPPETEYDVPEELLTEASKACKTALLIIGRNAGGEECDRRVTADYELTPEEQKLVQDVCSHFQNVVLVFNANGVMDTGWISEHPEIKAVLFMGLPGERGAEALVNLLLGTVTPSGKLCTTFAKSYWDYPTAKNFSFNKDEPDSIMEYRDYGLSAAENGSIGFEKSPVTVYQEDIFTGYRYFDTFQKQVSYPFGYGLSYAEFAITDESIEKNGADLLVTCKVTNTSSVYAGKEVVEVYVSAPEGNLVKPAKELKGFRKTSLLAPGASEEIRVRIPFSNLSSYSEARAAWILEAGCYEILLGNSSVNTVRAGVVSVEEEIVTEQCENRLSMNPKNREKLTLLTPPEPKAEVTSVQPDFILKQDDVCLKAAKVQGKSENETIRSLVSEMSIEELAVLANGYGPGIPFAAFGSEKVPTIDYPDGTPIGQNDHPTGMLGYVSPALSKYRIPSRFYKDGPAGVGKTAWPTDMILACSFDESLLYEFGKACGREASEQNVDSWLAPALNLHRNPLCGRNFEYFSEDPYLAGVCGRAVCLGAAENNPITTCPKHFAVNEQETYRRGSMKKSYDAVDSILSERAARELYLKPFEMAVRSGAVLTVMSAFNKVNGTFAAGNRDLCTHILREEWGYQGVVVTDWGDMDIVVDGADAVAAGNDVIMPGGPPVIRQVLKGYEEGRVTREELETAVTHLLNFVFSK